MKKIENIINKISQDLNCKLIANKNGLIELNTNYPEDLSFFFSNYSGIEMFLDKPYGIKIIGESEFVNANKKFYPKDDVIWEELENDISNDWSIIGKNFEMDQYISLDLNIERLGRCYDSFYSTHADPDFSPIIAMSFTDLLERLYESKGDELFWNNSEFKSLGNAYD